MLYRVTFNDPYGPRTPGHLDTGSRQGHYVDARSSTHAACMVRARKPHNDGTVTVQPWDTDSAATILGQPLDRDHDAYIGPNGLGWTAVPLGLSY